MRFCLLLFLLLTAASQASGDELLMVQARQAYFQGDYQQTIELAASQPGYAALVLVADARLSRYSLGRSPNPAKELKQAELAASKALILQPDAVQPRFALITVIGYRARTKSLFTGLRKRWASKGRSLIEQTLLLAPGDGWSHAMSGSWHLEIVRRTSKRRAKRVGASIEGGLEGCGTALQIAPHLPKITGQCGLALLAAHHPLADELAWQALQLAANSTGKKDAFACIRQQQAVTILDRRTKFGVEAARRLALGFLLAEPVTDWPIQCGQSSQSVSAPISVPDTQD